MERQKSQEKERRKAPLLHFEKELQIRVEIKYNRKREGRESFKAFGPFGESMIRETWGEINKFINITLIMRAKKVKVKVGRRGAERGDTECSHEVQEGLSTERIMRKCSLYITPYHLWTRKARRGRE